MAYLMLNINISMDLKDKDQITTREAIEHGINEAMAFLEQKYKPEYLSYNVHHVSELD